MMKLPKLLFALESFFPAHRAGTEVYVLNLCQYLIKKGWEVNILISTTDQQVDYTYEGIKVFTFDIPEKPIPQELNGIIAPGGILHFMARVQEINPDIIHFHSFGRAINGYHLKAVKELGIQTVFTPHLGSIFCIKGNLLLMGKANCDGRVDEQRCMNCLFQSRNLSPAISTALSYSIKQLIKPSFVCKYLPPALFQAHHRKNEMQRINKYADIIYSIAPWIQEAFMANGIHKAQLIPQGISPVFFDDKFKKTSSQKEILRFVFLGRMHSSKGFHLLQQVWDSLPKKGIELHIITNPSGDENEYFAFHKQWAKGHDEIIWNESLSQTEVATYLNRMDVLLLPSISNEVAPLVILEAATRKIPIIGSDYIAIKGMVQHETNGLLFKNGDKENLKEQIIRFIKDSSLRISLSKNIALPYSMNQVAQIIENDYLKLLTKEAIIIV